MLSEYFINYDLLDRFSVEQFSSREPFPWANLQGFLTPEGFAQLSRDFPPLEMFEEHRGIDRVYGQRPHNRYYLAYETSIYHAGERPAKGVLSREQLPATWRAFMEELETSERYHEFVRRALNVESFQVRYAWHLGFRGSEVSPHVDSPTKFGTHIIYFNASEEWDSSWGGETLVLGGRRTEAMDPDFSDFSTSAAVHVLDNGSFFFKNTAEAWHGVRPLTSPAGKFRRLFNVIFERPGNAPERGINLTARRSGLLERARAILGL
jgi:hypothetical protein